MKERKLYKLSQEDRDLIVRFSHNAQFARRYREEGIRVRTCVETLMQFSGYRDSTKLRDALRTGLFGMTDEPKQPESLRRKVDMWLSGRIVPENRQQLIRVCFALGMDEENAQNFMAVAGGGSLHHRNPEELAYLFALRNDLSYTDALALAERVKFIQLGNAGRTNAISAAFNEVRGADEFIRFIYDQRLNLGQMHNTAYEYFNRYLNVLTRPEGQFTEVPEQVYTVRDMVRMYLQLPGGGSGVMVKALRKHWPDELTISRIINRRMDVPRKVLTLLFLITDGEEGEEGALLETDDPIELFVDRYGRCNKMLDECGYSQLDPRSVFDWLAIYCMYTGEDNDANELMQAVLKDIFER